MSCQKDSVEHCKLYRLHKERGKPVHRLGRADSRTWTMPLALIALFFRPETWPTNPAQDKDPNSHALHPQESHCGFLAKPCLFHHKLHSATIFFKNMSSSWTWFQLLCFLPAFLHKLLSGSPHNLPLLVTSTTPPVVANPSRNSPKTTTRLGEQLGWRSLRVKAVQTSS